MPSVRFFVVMGPAGSGKSTVGRAVADRLGLPFLEGDEFHPAANVAKMRDGIPLDDDDRAPWIAAICRAGAGLPGSSCVIACSALNETVRGYFADRFEGATDFILLSAGPSTLASRMRRRSGHFMPASLLRSQLEVLTPPAEGHTVDAELPVDAVVGQVAAIVRRALSGDEQREHEHGGDPDQAQQGRRDRP